MRTAIVSDIHGNLMALDAVMTDIGSIGADEVWCAGDLGWGGPWATECIERVREAGWITVKGNTDVWITGDPQTVVEPEERRRLEEMAAAHAIPADAAGWLRELPLGHRGRGSVLMVHGTPESPFTAPQPDDDAASFSPYEGRADLVVYGHVHSAFVRKLSDGTIVANPGSVGMPKDDHSASYIVLDHSGAGWTVRIRRVAYDRRAAVAQARQTAGPIGDFFLQMVTV